MIGLASPGGRDQICDVVLLTVGFSIVANVPTVLATSHGLPALAGLGVVLVPLAAVVLLDARRLVVPPGAGPATCFFAAIVLSALLSSNPSASVGVVLETALQGYGVFVLLLLVAHGDHAKTLQRGVCAGVGFVSLLTVLQHLTGRTWTSFGGFATVGGYYIPSDAFSTPSIADYSETARLAGPIGEPNFYAMILVTFAPYVVTELRAAQRSRPVWFLALACTGYAIVLTYSRGAVLALVTTITVLALARRIPLHVLGIAALCGVVLILIVPQARDRVLELDTVSVTSPQASQDTAAKGRWGEAAAALAVFKAHPLTGVGPGRFPDYYEYYASPDLMSSHSGQGGRQAHDLYAGVAAEEGILGVASLAIFAGGLVQRAWRRTRTDPQAVASLGSLIGFLTASLFLHMAYVRFFWLAMALASVTLVSQRSAAHMTRTGCPPRPVPAAAADPA
ncbi:MAG: O-antigen ligase family protein [Actinomycetes bacterium]